VRKLRFRIAARRDIVEIARYVADRAKSPEVGKKVRDALLGECARIAKTQAVIGRLRADVREGLRSIPHRPYIIFFSYSDKEAVIVRVLHGARDLTSAFKDEEE
jgi:toxin ParE1/3/4